ncbi:amidohydrolase family protein [Arundinibacter roseus]|uniref:Amidohydrolase-related domain-containing protein n=1 Tax=Arundinibacter roseus TaxID=2070510 RepID=A0A4R4K9K8_9BACT|nr:amidohydrolase family protein [Arundinibacter roseus]TDB64213.1 hypothetical protein EZE20_14870 [Arundinibacter roseus]
MKKYPLIALLCLTICTCQSQEKSPFLYTAFTGATLIDGHGGAPIVNGVLVIQNGRIVSIGTRDQVKIPEKAKIIDASGKTIVPGLINAHGHVGDVQGIEGGHYSAQNVRDNLAIYERYGITSVVSLGGDQPEAEPLRAVHADSHSNPPNARLYIAGEVITGQTPAEALTVVEKNHRMGVDFMKIRVDDNLGSSPKMLEAVYRAVIRRSHELGYKIATHMYYLDDARKLLEAGTDMLAHSVRDLPVDEAFVKLLQQKKVPYCPTLTRELSAFVYGDTASFFSDPYFLKEYDQKTIAPLLNPARQQQIRQSKAARIYKQQLPTAMANLKTLSDAGVPIVFGTDSGVPTRFIGYFEHLELEMMAEAGLSPMQILQSATKNAAEYMGLKNVGTLSPGNYADFLILDADPLADIRNLRKISSVYSLRLRSL